MYLDVVTAQKAPFPLRSLLLTPLRSHLCLGHGPGQAAWEAAGATLAARLKPQAIKLGTAKNGRERGPEGKKVGLGLFYSRGETRREEAALKGGRAGKATTESREKLKQGNAGWRGIRNRATARQPTAAGGRRGPGR